MSKYNIYTIDESNEELNSIKRAIYEHALVDDTEISFKNIDINSFESEKAIANHLLEEILEKNTNSIIIDYKLSSRVKMFDGSRIFEYLVEQVPRFPLIILTNRAVDCAKQSAIDPDKIYEKASITNIDSELSKKLVTKLFRNIDLYQSRLNEIEVLENEIEDSSDKESDIKKILECDEKMSQITPGWGSSIISRQIFNEAFFDDLSKELKEAVKVINEYYGKE